MCAASDNRCTGFSAVRLLFGSSVVGFVCAVVLLMSFFAMPGLCCFLLVTLSLHMHGITLGTTSPYLVGSIFVRGWLQPTSTRRHVTTSLSTGRGPVRRMQLSEGGFPGGLPPWIVVPVLRRCQVQIHRWIRLANSALKAHMYAAAGLTVRRQFKHGSCITCKPLMCPSHGQLQCPRPCDTVPPRGTCGCHCASVVRCN